MTDWTDPDTFAQALEQVETREKGHCFEDFEEGDVIEHAPGLTLREWGNELWMSQTLNHDPAYWRSDAAVERGYDLRPIHPDYLVAATLGITVEDLSEKGGYFLGRTDVRFPTAPVAPGTRLRVESEVVETATSSSRPQFGIVTWRTRGTDGETGDVLCSYERTNMIPRRQPVETDGGSTEPPQENATDDSIPETFVTPDGGYFEDFVDALERADERDAAVAYRHERGRTQDDVTIATLPLATLNTAKQHHNADVMADSPSGGIVTYGDVTRSTALGHARSDERTWREIGFDDETFHTFVGEGDTVYAFTRVLEAEDDLEGDVDTDPAKAGTVRFEHIAFNQHDEPVYSGIRTAAIEKRPTGQRN